ncbi:MAG: DUF5667 domain-containing protein [Pseudomonadota bacterium]
MASILLVLCDPALSGHGTLSAFTDPDVLVDPGRTPDQGDYDLDRSEEQARLDAAADPYIRYGVAYAICREKLAEVIAMADSGKPLAAQTALDEYARNLDQAWRAVVGIKRKSAPDIAGHFVNTLLEHRYIASLYFSSMPSATAKMLERLAALATDYHAKALPLTPYTFAESIRLKEHEVLWSWEAARRAVRGQ